MLRPTVVKTFAEAKRVGSGVENLPASSPVPLCVNRRPIRIACTTIYVSSEWHQVWRSVGPHSALSRDAASHNIHTHYALIHPLIPRQQRRRQSEAQLRALPHKALLRFEHSAACRPRTPSDGHWHERVPSIKQPQYSVPPLASQRVAHPSRETYGGRVLGAALLRSLGDAGSRE